MNPDLAWPKQWMPVILASALTNAVGCRAPQHLRNTVAQFMPATNPRYTRTATSTYCNIFLWDVSRAMGAEIPHWIPDPAQSHGKREIGANGIVDWLEGPDGKAAGWWEASRADAHKLSALGYPVAAVWKNPAKGSGHVAILLPPKGAELHIAQAGARNFFDEPLSAGFGTLPVRFFAHD